MHVWYNLVQLDSFIMGINKNSKNIHVSHDVTPEERKNLREKNKGSICLMLWRHVRANNILFPLVLRSFHEQKGVKDTSTLGAK